MNTKTKILIAGALLCVVAALTPTTALAQQSGVQVWAQTCGNCHLIQPANRYTANQWESLTMHMGITARLTDAEIDAVLQFLKGGAKPVASAASAERPAPGVLLAAANPPAPSALIAAADSLEDFSSLCVACHGSSGQGDGPVASALNPRPADFTNAEFQQDRTDTDLGNAIREGKGTMPGFASQLTDQQIQALVRYMRTFGKTVER